MRKFILISVFILSLLGGAITLSLRDLTNAGDEPQTPLATLIDNITTAPKSTKIVAVGDMMLTRSVETWMNSNGDDYPFLGLNDLFTGKDVVMANLEGPIIANHARTPNGSTSFSFAPKVAALLKSHGVTHVSIANNHTFDRTEAGFLETQQHLATAGVNFFGHPRMASKDYVLRETINDKEFVFIGLNEAVSSYFKLDEALKLIADTRIENPNAFVLVSIHWGIEYGTTSSKKYVEMAHKILDSGANLIIGSHPHVVQQIEEYNGKLIFYSLGNFIFDQYFSTNTQQGLAIDIEMKKDQSVFKILPIDIIKSQPTVMELVKATKFLEDLAARSSESLAEQIKQGIIIRNL